MGRKVLEVLVILAVMLLAGMLWASLQDVELEARLRAAHETVRLYTDSTALLRTLCGPHPMTTRPPARPLLMTLENHP